MGRRKLIVVVGWFLANTPLSGAGDPNICRESVLGDSLAVRYWVFQRGKNFHVPVGLSADNKLKFGGPEYTVSGQESTPPQRARPYGSPYELGGITAIDVEPVGWRPASDHRLLRLPYDPFREQALPAFAAQELWTGNLLLVPVENKREAGVVFQFGKIISVQGDDVELTSGENSPVKFSKNLLFEWNGLEDPEALDAARRLVRRGAMGIYVKVERPIITRDNEMTLFAGSYFVLDQMPFEFDESFDAEVIRRLQEFHDDGIPVVIALHLLAEGGSLPAYRNPLVHYFRSRVASERFAFGFLMLSRHPIDPYNLVVAATHHRDHRRGMTDQVWEFVGSLIESNHIAGMEGQAIYKFIQDQRAFAYQLAAIARDQSVDPERVVSQGPLKMTLTNLLHVRVRLASERLRPLATTVDAVMGRLRSDPIRYQGLAQLIRQHSVPTEHLALSQLLPAHFPPGGGSLAPTRVLQAADARER